MRYLRQSLDFLLFTNIFIAFGAVAQGLVTYHLIGAQPSYIILTFLFCATIFIYNISILIAKPKQPQLSKFRRVRWIFTHFKLNVSIAIMAAILLFFLFLLVSTPSKILIILLGILSLGYALPLFSAGDRKFGLRNIPGLKLILIALVWSLSSVVLPIFELQNQEVSLPDIIILTAKRFLLVAAITIPFDIRDIFQDKAYDLKTIPTVFGEKGAYIFCQIMLVSYLVLLFVFRNQGFNSNFFALTATTFLTGWLIFKSKWEKNEYYYFFYLDGILILQYLMLFFFSFIF
ncbi:UbiA family prenyltransferase [Pedobacter cryophilus]|uniref:Prenyltransferase n=1 Tax=Pedobacter cryophilus TaxID=2571271 RepID=A0A4U1C4C4_9SPHI|nr:UbiA family prenyltransferase [Pedobacter cryophilus]TKC00209.1 hypothetical protein FA046_00575 [Pedobacter cryophilus]